MICYRCGGGVQDQRFAPSYERPGCVFHQDWIDCILSLQNQIEFLRQQLERSTRSASPDRGSIISDGKTAHGS